MNTEATELLGLKMKKAPVDARPYTLCDKKSEKLISVDVLSSKCFPIDGGYLRIVGIRHVECTQILPEKLKGRDHSKNLSKDDREKLK
jgi:hypothetical protein